MNTSTATTTTDQLREYQETAVDFLLNHPRALLGDEAGVGKTIPTLMGIQALGGRTLIVAPRNAFGVWKRESRKWLGREPVVYSGTGRNRDDLNRDFVLINYAGLGEVQDHCWDLIIFDEAHKLKNRKAKTLFQQAQKLKAERMWHLTGTPVVAGAQDLWSLLHLLDPKRYMSFWTFVKKYAWLEPQHIGQGRVVMNVEGIRNVKALNAELSAYMLRRTKAEVLPELPAKTRQAMPLEMTKRQAKAYAQMEQALMALLDEYGDMEDPENWLRAPGVLAQMTRLRQLLTTPRLLGIEEDGAALEALAEEAEAGRPMVVFTPWAEALPYIQSTLEAEGYTVGLISGSVSDERITKVVEDFQTHASTSKRAIVSTIRMGTSWTATEASTCYFLGYDWTPGNNTQSEDRLHRYGQKDNVTARYFVHDGTIDEHVLDILSGKLTVAKVLFEAHEGRAQWLEGRKNGRRSSVPMAEMLDLVTSFDGGDDDDEDDEEDEWGDDE